jgi:hypothetical protein
MRAVIEEHKQLPIVYAIPEREGKTSSRVETKNTARTTKSLHQKVHIAIQTSGSDNHSYRKQGLPFDLPIH